LVKSDPEDEKIVNSYLEENCIRVLVTELIELWSNNYEEMKGINCCSVRKVFDERFTKSS
jgi:hypothetical protein